MNQLNSNIRSCKYNKKTTTQTNKQRRGDISITRILASREVHLLSSTALHSSLETNLPCFPFFLREVLVTVSSSLFLSRQFAFSISLSSSICSSSASSMTNHVLSPPPPTCAVPGPWEDQQFSQSKKGHATRHGGFPFSYHRPRPRPLKWLLCLWPRRQGKQQYCCIQAAKWKISS